MDRKQITAVVLKGLKPAPSGQRLEIFDSIVPAFGIRSTDQGVHSYFVKARFGGSPNQSRRTIARVGQISLAEARAKAKEWAEAAALKRDPAEEARKVKAAEAERLIFGAELERYIDKHISRQKRAKDTTRELRTYLLPAWESRPLEEITKADVRKLIEQIADRGAERQAHNIFGLTKTFFSWCVETDRISSSPCEGLRPRKLIGEKRIRTRVLDDDELRAVWNAAEATAYPYGPFIKLVVLTGARKSEAAEATWSEFDLDAGIWTVPEERFKSGVAHRVPLSKMAIALLQDLPQRGAFIFTFDGEAPTKSHSKLQRRLKRLVDAELGRNVDWQTHDLRRTVRTRLAGLGIPDAVAEKVIGHAARGLNCVYQQYGFENEMRDALERWAGKLRDLVSPPPKNVSDFDAERRARA